MNHQLFFFFHIISQYLKGSNDPHDEVSSLCDRLTGSAYVLFSPPFLESFRALFQDTNCKVVPNLIIAQVARYCPREASDVCYSVNVPDVTASSGNGDIFFQISGPTSWSWIALGQGSQMANSNIFVIYTSASGDNVTLSPRTGKGHVMPRADSQAKVTLLEGSGVQNGEMTANIRCMPALSEPTEVKYKGILETEDSWADRDLGENCNSWSNGKMDLSSSNTAWIWAAKSGSELKTDDVSAMIREHDDKDAFTLDLTKARGGSSLNPFLASTSDSSSTSNDQPSNTRTADVAGSTSQSDDAVQGASGSGKQREYRTRIAHGVLMSLAFVVFFPLGAVLVRVLKIRSTAWIHSGTQVVGYLIALVGMGLGVWLTTKGYGTVRYPFPLPTLYSPSLLSCSHVSLRGKS